MNRSFKILAMIIVIYIFSSCTSILHVYEGQRYFPDEELGVLFVTENYRVYKFDEKELSKTFKSTVIKAKPGQHQLQIIAKISQVNSTDTVKDELTHANKEIITWDAFAGHEYQLVSSGIQSDIDKFLIKDVTSNQ
jgi:hypothetical protein